MKMIEMLNGKKKHLFFENAAYVPNVKVSIVSVNKLKSQGFYWNMVKDVLYAKSSGAEICEINEHFGLALFEFNSMSSSILTNSVQSRNLAKAISWTWHFRLGHCRLEVINQLKKIDGLEILKGEIPKTVHCDTCAVSKMHQIINRAQSGRATKSYQMLHFDLTILGRGFDGISCIAHFTDEFISFNWVFPLLDHKEKTLIPVFKSMINRCDRAELSIRSIVMIIRSGQETSIGGNLEE